MKPQRSLRFFECEISIKRRNIAPLERLYSLSRGEDANSQHELSRGNRKEQFITVMGAEVRYRLDAIHSGRFSRIDIVHHYWYH